MTTCALYLFQFSIRDAPAAAAGVADLFPPFTFNSLFEMLSGRRGTLPPTACPFNSLFEMHTSCPPRPAPNKKDSLSILYSRCGDIHTEDLSERRLSFQFSIRDAVSPLPWVSCGTDAPFQFSIRDAVSLAALWTA